MCADAEGVLMPNVLWCTTYGGLVDVMVFTLFLGIPQHYSVATLPQHSVATLRKRQETTQAEVGYLHNMRK